MFLFTEFYEKIIEFYESVVGKQNYGTVKNCIVTTRSGECIVYMSTFFICQNPIYTQPKIYFPQQTIIPKLFSMGEGETYFVFSACREGNFPRDHEYVIFDNKIDGRICIHCQNISTP